MGKHRETEAIRTGTYTGGIAIWRCPKCDLEFQCGDTYTEKMTCKGIYQG